MQDGDGIDKTKPPQEETADEYKASETLDADSEDTTEFREPLTPSKSDGASAESQADSEPKYKHLLRWLERWGPYKRWAFYREMQQRQKIRSSLQRDYELEDNERSRLPDDEKVEVPAIWIIELYTPATIEKLHKGIIRLGWERSKLSYEKTNLIEWMKETRKDRAMNWINLGLVTAPDNTNFTPSRTATLPLGVKAAFPTLVNLTPSLTALIIPFQLDNDAAASLEAPLRADFKTRVRRHHGPWHIARYILMGNPSPFSYSEEIPSWVRREAVKLRLRDLEKDCVQWIQERLPGVFTSLPGIQNPTAVLIMTEKVQPMTEDARKIGAFSELALGKDRGTRELDGWPGVRLAFPDSLDDKKNRLTFACLRRDAIPGESRENYSEPASNWTITQYADLRIRDLSSQWAINCLLSGYYEALSTLRDQAARDSNYQPVRDLKALRSMVRTMLYDIDVCTQDILEFAEAGLHQSTASEETPTSGKRGLLFDLMSSQVELARRVKLKADSLKSMLSVSSDLSQTISNLRLQRLILVLAFLSAAAALISILR